MFAFPDNTPDLDSMKRLWHEILRTLYDRELNEEILQTFLDVSLFDTYFLNYINFCDSRV
jgi:hypothetical protein